MVNTNEDFVPLHKNKKIKQKKQFLCYLFYLCGWCLKRLRCCGKCSGAWVGKQYPAEEMVEWKFLLYLQNVYVVRA